MLNIRIYTSTLAVNHHLVVFYVYLLYRSVTLFTTEKRSFINIYEITEFQRSQLKGPSFTARFFSEDI
jgi:hypothetical protein